MHTANSNDYTGFVSGGVRGIWSSGLVHGAIDCRRSTVDSWRSASYENYRYLNTWR